MKTGSPRRYARLAVRRAGARRRSSPQLALLAGAGDANLGDEVMLEATRAILPGVDLLPIDHPATERRLGSVGLSGPAVFDGVLVGGGTLVNPHFLRLLSGVLEPGLPAWMLGTGVGSSGFAMPSEVCITPWGELLQGFEGVWVRGPLSAERLHRLGVDQARVCGDLALAATPEQPLSLTQRGTIAVNPGASRVTVGGSDAAVRAAALAAALRPFLAEGGTVVPFGMHRDDAEGIAALASVLGGQLASPVFPADSKELWSLFAGVEAVIGVRLHAAALAWAVGVPALLLAYRDKCRDFALQLGVEDCLIDSEANAAKIEAGLRRVLDQGRVRGHAVHAKALAARREIEAAAVDIRSVLDRIDASAIGS